MVYHLQKSLLKMEENFYTENKGRNDKHYGIGLSFAQKIAMRHQGQLILSNPQNGGAQVTLLIKKF